MSLSAPMLLPIVRAADPVQASGILRAIDAREGTVILKKTTGELLELRVGDSAKMTLDGKAAGLDALKPGMKVAVSYDPGTGTILTLKTDRVPVTLRIVISKDGDCRVSLRKSTDPDPLKAGERTPPVLPVVTDCYIAHLDDRPLKSRHVAGSDDSGGSLVFRPTDPKLLKSSASIYYPRTFRTPCDLSPDIVELGRNSSIGVQFWTPRFNFLVYVCSDDDLRENASVRVSLDMREEAKGMVRKLLIEKPVEIDHPEELAFRLPQVGRELGKPLTLCIVVRANNGKKPAETLQDTAVALKGIVLRAAKEKALGLTLESRRDAVFVKKVESDGLAARAGMLTGDEITAVEGRKVGHPCDVGMSLGFPTEANLTVRRGGKEQPIKLKLD